MKTYNSFNIIKTEVFMARTLHYSSKSLLDVQFTADLKGYDAFQVDKVLDDVIDDLKYYEKYYDDSKNYIRQLETEVQKLKEEKKRYELEIGALKNRLQGIKTSQNLNDSNIDLIRRISKLEDALYKKGVDPTTIK